MVTEYTTFLVWTLTNRRSSIELIGRLSDLGRGKLLLAALLILN